MRDEDKYYNYNKKINIINNIEKDFNIKEEINLNKEIIYNKYKDYTDFSKLFSRKPRVSTSPQTTTVSTPQSQPQVSTPRQSTPVSPSQTTPQTSSPVQTSQQGRTYDASQMWSPTSWAGNVYEWNRGVVVIAQDGTFIKEKLDGTYNHHADATVRSLGSLGIVIENTNAPFQAGIDGASEGAIVFQSEGDNGLIYFPPAISEEQLSELTNIITPRSSFNFSYTYGEEIFEDQDYQSVLSYAVNLNNQAQVRR